MFQIKTFLMLLLCFVGVVGKTSLAAEAKILRIAYADSWQPISFYEQGQARGLLPSAAESFFHTGLGIKVEHIAVPWGRAQQMVRQGAVDGFITTPTPDRLKFTRTTQGAFSILPFVAATKFDTQTDRLIVDPDDLDAIRDKTFCDVLGNSWATFFYKDKPVRLVTAPTIQECLKLLAADRVDGIIHAQPVLKLHLDKLGLAQTIRLHRSPSHLSPAFKFLLSNKSAWGQGLLERIDTHIQKMGHVPDFLHAPHF